MRRAPSVRINSPTDVHFNPENGHGVSTDNLGPLGRIYAKWACRLFERHSNEFLRHCRSLFPGNGILRRRDCGVEKARHVQLISAETKPPHENPPIRRYLHDTGKSQFVCDCVVELGGLELPTKRLSAGSEYWATYGDLAALTRSGARKATSQRRPRAGATNLTRVSGRIGRKRFRADALGQKNFATLCLTRARSLQA